MIRMDSMVRTGASATKNKMRMGGCGTSGQLCGAGPLCKAVPGEKRLVGIIREKIGTAIGVSKLTEGTEKARGGFRENNTAS